jgi:tRNA(Ile)-lysidine synthase
VAGRAPLTDLRARFDARLAGLGVPAGAALVAVSGGADSLALLDLLVGAPSAGHLTLAVLHVDHGIAPESGAVAERVRELASRYGLPFALERLSLGAGASETKAREARYRAFRRVLRRLGAAALFTAHHADDQVETLLMRFLKGSGPAGLAGMSARRGRLVRPLLEFTRAELEAHVAALGLEAWQDPANRDPRHLRAWLRHDVLPLLERRLPALRRRLLRASDSFREHREAWEQLLVEWPEVGFRRETDGVSVAAARLRGYSSTVSRCLLRAAARRLGWGIPERHVSRLQELMAQGHTGQVLDLPGGYRAELAFDRLRLFRADQHHRAGSVALTGARGTIEVGRWRVEWSPGIAPDRVSRRGRTTWVVSGADLSVRCWRPGDRMRPLRGAGSRLVVRCMQEAKVPRSHRPDWPVVEHQGVIVWVPDVCRGDGLVPAPGADAVRIDVRRN